MSGKGPRNPERSFGISVGAVLCAIALFSLWRGRVGRAEWIGAVGVALVVFGLLRPLALKPISDPWWKLAAALGWVNARVLLTIMFAIVLTPLGLVWRMLGTDPLARRRRSWNGWSAYPPRYKDKRHFERMF